MPSVAYLDQIQLPPSFSLRPIEPQDNAAIAQVIRDVSKEWGLSSDQGFSAADPDLDQLYEVYQRPNSRYWVLLENDLVVGGAGIAPLAGAPTIIELQKMYFRPQARGRGIANILANLCFIQAHEWQFEQCYLETTASLTTAMTLYQSLGFSQLGAPLGNTGHCACEIAMIRPVRSLESAHLRSRTAQD
ncbi:GNAT family N-acetyltransferase [Vibrio sp. SM6]|uniref:GNAT family N-acetyltransferase n=1 Tax=Vibrio agarilyticus TaxID=2726741 RepID=A0A7X8TRE0_9VIBR|nr:GNAT family N-acetyltransferase [Vibrio agarilyticus]NLS13587.1 GNAT family N-acetyltransferase [Vibrio agarilyticus]